MATLESIEVTLESFGKKFDAIDRRFEAMDQKFDTLIITLDRRFNSIDQRFDSLERKFDEKIDEFAAMCAREFTSIRSDISGVGNRLETLEENCVTKEDLAAFAQSRMLR